MSQNKFINDVNNNFNNLKNKISKKIDLDNNYEFIFKQENNIDIVEILLDEKLKIKAEYNILGLYNIPLSIWYWGWNISFINKKLTNKLEKVRKFKNILEENYVNFDSKTAEEIYYLLSNGNFYISSINIDKLIKLALYLSESIWYFPVKYINSETQKTYIDLMDKTEYIIITKILQYR